MLACCMEIVNAIRSGDPASFVSHQPVHQVSSTGQTSSSYIIIVGCNTVEMNTSNLVNWTHTTLSLHITIPYLGYDNIL